MEKHFCDVCNKELESSREAITLSIGRSYSPNPHLIYKEICDSCAETFTKILAVEANLIRRRDKNA